MNKQGFTCLQGSQPQFQFQMEIFIAHDLLLKNKLLVLFISTNSQKPLGPICYYFFLKIGSESKQNNGH